MSDTVADIELVLAAIAQSEDESARRTLAGLDAQLARFAKDIEATRRQLEALRPELDAARLRLARLEQVEPALGDARRRLRALRATDTGFANVRARIAVLGPALESARRVVEASPHTVLPATRRQIRTLATELQAISRALSGPPPGLELLAQHERVLDDLAGILASAREEVLALEVLVGTLEFARSELRALATDLEAPRRALRAAIGAGPAGGPAGAPGS
jgi:septal ring factor EnvC (AmiA/AmiB activator)